MGCGCGGKSAQERAQAMQNRANTTNGQTMQRQAQNSGQVGGVATVSATDYLAELAKLKNGN